MPEGQGGPKSKESEVEKSFLHTGYHDWCPWRQAQYFSFLVIKDPAFSRLQGDPSAALGMTVRGSSLSVSLGTFDLSASRILIKEVRVCAHHLIEERQYPWSLIPNPCFQISGFGE